MSLLTVTINPLPSLWFMFSSDLSFTFKLFFLIPRKQVLDLVKLYTQDQVIIINVPCAMYLLEENKCIDYDIYAG